MTFVILKKETLVEVDPTLITNTFILSASSHRENPKEPDSDNLVYQTDMVLRLPDYGL